jgi:hypothetical protein
MDDCGDPIGRLNHRSLLLMVINKSHLYPLPTALADGLQTHRFQLTFCCAPLQQAKIKKHLLAALVRNKKTKNICSLHWCGTKIQRTFARCIGVQANVS